MRRTPCTYNYSFVIEDAGRVRSGSVPDMELPCLPGTRSITLPACGCVQQPEMPSEFLLGFLYIVVIH